MNIGLFELAGKWVNLLVISIMTFFNGSYVEKEVNLKNENNIKDIAVVDTITPYKTETKLNSKLPSNVSKVITEGQNGIKYEVKDTDKQEVIQDVVNKVVEKGSGAYGVYTGRLSGYGPDCTGCSGTGGLACHTKNGGNHNLVQNGIYYEDDQFGKVRIIAAALKQFPCGTIIEITKPGKDPFYAVVLDTGATMVNKWNEGIVWMDLAYSSEKDKSVFAVDDLTGTNIKFNVQRWGW